MTVKLGMAVDVPYVPATTPVFAIDIVPEVVIGPPVNPVPVLIWVTLPIGPRIATVFNIVIL